MIHDDRVQAARGFLASEVTLYFTHYSPAFRGRGARLARVAELAQWFYAVTLYGGDDATLDHLHEAVATFEEIQGTARRVLGGTHPLTAGIEDALRKSRAALRARETPASSA